MNKTLIQAAFFFYEWPHQLFRGACSCLVGLTFEVIASNREQTFLPSCRNQCCYISKSVISDYANQDSGGRPRCPFAGRFCHLTPTSCREPRSQIKAAVLWLHKTKGCRAGEIWPGCAAHEHTSVKNRLGFIYQQISTYICTELKLSMETKNRENKCSLMKNKCLENA